MADYSDFNAMEMQRARANALRKRKKVRDPDSIDFSEPEQELGPANSGEDMRVKPRQMSPQEALEKRRMTLLASERR